MENIPDVQDQYHTRYRYLLIDEFQDTNVAQYRLAHLLTGQHRNLCVVGDRTRASIRGVTPTSETS